MIPEKTDSALSMPSLEGARYIPHAPPMAFLGRLLEHSTDDVACEVIPGIHDRLFVRNGTVDAIIGVEYMAQTVAAFAGLSAPDEQSRPDIGYLIATKQLSFACASFEVGRPLRVYARRYWGDTRLGCFETRISSGDEILARSSMTVYQPTQDEIEA